MSELIRDKIAAVRSRYTLVEAATGSSIAIGAFVGAILVGAMLDWWMDFPWLLRAMLLIGYVGGAGYLFWKHALRAVVNPPDDEDFALRVEHVQPSFASRLISAVQFAEAPAVPEGISASMTRAMVQEAEEMAGTVDFGRVVDPGPMMRYGIIAVIVLLVSGVLFAAGGSTARDLVARVFLSNVVLPTKTRIECLSGSRVVARGEDVELKARATGWLPSLGRAEIEYASGQKQTLMLEQSSEDSAQYSSMLSSVQESFTYRIRIYDGKTETFDVKVTPRPTVSKLNCRVTYPQYTGLGTVDKPSGDLSLLAGSKLHIEITASKKLRATSGTGEDANYVQIFTNEKGGANPRWPLALKSGKTDELTCELAPEASTAAFSVHLVDDEGVESKDTAVYRIDMISDRPPVVRVTTPERKEVLVTRQSSLDVGFSADDDYGLASLTLRYRVDEGDELAIALPFEGNAKAARGVHRWSISSVPMPAGKQTMEGSVIEYWIVAEDGNDVSGPSRSVTEHYQARVVSRDDKQKELIERTGEQLNIMRSITERQEETSRQLGGVIEQTPATQPAAQPVPPANLVE